MAFVDQVEDLTSLTVSDTGELSQFLKDGVLDVTNRCLAARPQDILDFTAVSAEQTGNGLDLGGAKIVSVIREAGTNDDWRSCRQVPPGLQGRVADASSLHYASKYNPAYMEFEDGKVSVFPDPGADPNAFKVYYVNNVPVDESDAAIVHSSTTIKNFPLDKVYLVPLYAAIKLLQATMGSNVISLTTTPPIAPSLTAVSFSVSNSLSITAVVPVMPAISVASVSVTGASPTYTKPIINLKAAPIIENLSITAVSPAVPSLTTVTFTSIDSALDAGVSVFTTTTLAAASIYTGSAPTYTKPTLALGAKPTISPLSLSTVAPIPPPAPSFTTPTVGAITVSSTTLSNIGVAPIYTKPTLVSRSSFEDFFSGTEDANPFSDNDPGVFSISAVAPVSPALVTTTIDESGLTAPTFNPPAMSPPDFADTNTWISTEEDSEMLASRVQEIQTKIGEYSARMQEAQAQFAKENTSFQADLQIAVQNAQLESAEDGTKLQRYGSEQATYQANVGKEVQEYGQNLSRYSTEIGLVYQAWAKTESDSLQQYSVDIQNELNDFNSANAEYQVKLQEAIHQCQTDAAKAQQQAQLDSADAQQEASLLLQKENQEYAVSLQKFNAEVQKYQAEISTAVQEYTQNLQRETQLWQQERQTDLQKYGSDIQNELNEYSKESALYQAAIQESMQEVQAANQIGLAKSQADLQVAIANKDRDQQRQLQNAVNDMGAINSDNGTKIQLYQQELAVYNALVSKEVQDYQQNLAGDIQVWQAERQTDLQQYGSDLQNELNKYNLENSQFTSQLQADIQDATLADANEARKLQQYSSELQTYQAIVNKDIQTFTSQLQADIQDMQAIVANNQALLTKYQGDTALYQAEIASETQEQTTKMQQYQLLTVQLKAEYDGSFAAMYSQQQQQAAPAAQQGR